MKLGQAALEALRADITGQLRRGDEIVVAGAIGLKATDTLLKKESEKLRSLFSPSFLRDAGAMREKYGIREPIQEGELWNLAAAQGASALYALKTDGFLSGLWKMAEASGVGLHVDLRKVPVRQETIEICECFDVNPYQADSEGALLLGFRNAYTFLEICREKEIPAAVIGVTNGENARLLYSGEGCSYLNRPGHSK